MRHEKIAKISIIFILIFFYQSFVYGQEYLLQYVNRGPLYATASVLQDYDGDGDLDILVTRREATTDNRPSSVELLENDGTGHFPKFTLFENLSSPVDLDPGDFNNDGKIDFVISDRYVNINSGAVVLAVQLNDGSFSTSFIEDSIRTDESAAADFDSDGNLDIVSVGFNREKVSIYWNNGNLNFSKQEITDTVIQVELVAADDIDQDGDIDIIYGGGGLDGFKILYNNGSGDFDSSRTLYLNNGQYSNAKRGLTVVDLNNDGIKDILAFSGVGFGGMYFLDGAKDYSSVIIDVDGIDLGGDIVSADIDGNGLKDIIRQNRGDDYLSILYQESEMNFKVEILELNWDNRGPGQMSLGDLDNDGDIDLVFPENGNVDGDLSWFENIDGKLYRHHLYSEIEAVAIPLIVDIDSDGDQDILITAGDEGPKKEEDEISLFENVGNNRFIEHRIDDDIAFPGDIKTGDLDGDGSLEIAATAYEDSNLVWYKKVGEDWIKVLVDENLVNPRGLEIADIDSDNDLDIIVCAFGDGEVVLYENNGSAVFSRKIIDNSVSEPRKIVAADFNNDTELDAAVISSDTNNTLLIYLNDGNGSFTKSVISEGQMGYDIEVNDWDGNGYPDIFAGFDKGVLGDELRDVAVFLNDGNANFTDSTLIVLEERTNTIELFDADNDSDLDILVGSSSSSSPLRIGINNNNEIIEIMEIVENPTRIFGLDAGDINGDGIFDIVASDRLGATNNLLLLTGDLSTSIFSPQNGVIQESFILLQNYPNPFNPATHIQYSIPRAIPSEVDGPQVKLIVYDILGREVATLVNEIQRPGNYEVIFNAGKYASGVYYYQLKAGDFIQTKKMLLMK